MKHIARCLLSVTTTMIAFLAASPALSQPAPKFAPNEMDTVLYGAAYYPEYMPYERLDQDVQLMQQAGLTVVRIGESSWGLWEPADGQFEFAWMDQVVDRLSKAGIKIIMGTFTVVTRSEIASPAINRTTRTTSTVCRLTVKMSRDRKTLSLLHSASSIWKANCS
jgi:hypothetical protein